MRKLIVIAAGTLTATQSQAHEIAAEHAHAGPVVLMELPQILMVSAVVATLLGLVVYLLPGRKSHRDD